VAERADDGGELRVLREQGLAIGVVQQGLQLGAGTGEGRTGGDAA
jgi:hypothetical protein